MRKLCDGRRNERAGGLAGRERGVVGESSEGERDDVVDVVFVGHALDAVPAASADVGDVGGPVIAGGPHDVVYGFLLGRVGSSAVVVVHGEPCLRAVDQGRGNTGVGHDDRERP